ncbi:MAG: hypothetical protein AABX39_01510, partial [Nanoarchaeota archaeon]
MTKELWQYVWKLERPSSQERLLELRKDSARHIGYVIFDPYKCPDCKSQLQAMQVGVFAPVRKAYFPLEKVIRPHSLEDCAAEMRKNGEDFMAQLKLDINENPPEPSQIYQSPEEELDLLANLYFADLNARRTFIQALNTDDSEKLLKILKKSKKQFDLTMKLLSGEVTQEDFDEA